MKKILIGIAAFVLVAVAAGGSYGTWHFWSRASALESELAAVQADKSKLEAEAQSLTESGEQTAKSLGELQKKAAELDAARAALAGGTAIAAVEAAAKAAKPVTPEHFLAIGGIRLLVKGASDPEALAAFDKALQVANWPASLRAACAAQAGLAVTGRAVERSADCAKLPAQPAADPVPVAEAPKP